MPAGLTGWLPAQEHAGENIGDTPTHVLFVELKEAGAGDPRPAHLGPA
jgi:beta-alanine degradation protein BauB